MVDTPPPTTVEQASPGTQTQRVNDLAAENAALRKELDELRAAQLQVNLTQQQPATGTGSAVSPLKTKLKAADILALPRFRYGITSVPKFMKQLINFVVANEVSEDALARAVVFSPGVLDERTQAMVHAFLSREVPNLASSVSPQDAVRALGSVCSWQKLEQALLECKCGTLGEPFEVWATLSSGLTDNLLAAVSPDVLKVAADVEDYFQHLTGSPRELFYSADVSALRDSILIGTFLRCYPKELWDHLKNVPSGPPFTTWAALKEHLRHNNNTIRKEIQHYQEARARRSAGAGLPAPPLPSNKRGASSQSAPQVPAAKKQQQQRSYAQAARSAGPSSAPSAPSSGPGPSAPRGGAGGRRADGLPADAINVVPSTADPIPTKDSHPSSAGWRHYIANLTGAVKADRMRNGECFLCGQKSHGPKGFDACPLKDSMFRSGALKYYQRSGNA